MRTLDHPSPSGQLIRLEGRSHMLQARPGTRLVARRGSVALTEPARLLADAAWSGRVIIRSGETHCIAEGGWVTLHSRDDEAEVLWVPPQIARPRGVPMLLVAMLRFFARRAFA